MANHHAVILNISAEPQSGGNWKFAPVHDPDDANNPTRYWYKFSGGNRKDDNGDQDGDVSKIRDSFRINLKRLDGDDDRFEFVKFWSENDPGQLTGDVFPNKKTVQVTNQCSVEWDDMVYGVTVSPVKSKITFRCHPVISNKQHSLDWFSKLVRLVKRLGFFFVR